MSKQWGHGNITGQTEALRKAAEAVKQLQNRDVYAMALINKLMNTHPDCDLVEEAHQAIKSSKHLWELMCRGLWYGFDAGVFVETYPPMPKKAALEMFFSEASKQGWNG
jgi:hypothetical protein